MNLINQFAYKKKNHVAYFNMSNQRLIISSFGLTLSISVAPRSVYYYVGYGFHFEKVGPKKMKTELNDWLNQITIVKTRL